MTQLKKITKTQLEELKQMYFNYSSLTDMAKALNISRSSIRHHIQHNKWDMELAMQRNDLFNRIAETKKPQFIEITNSTISILKKSLHHLATRDEPPTVVEAEKAAKILDILDRITRLDDGAPTSIHSNQEKILTIETIAEKLRVDPFYQEEITYEPTEESIETIIEDNK
jgi:predicted DNA-binding protein YlxM (UPF0122 family)